MYVKIERPSYMQQLIESKDNGLIKIVTAGLAPLLSAVGLHVA